MFLFFLEKFDLKKLAKQSIGVMCAWPSLHWHVLNNYTIYISITPSLHWHVLNNYTILAYQVARGCRRKEKKRVWRDSASHERPHHRTGYFLYSLEQYGANKRRHSKQVCYAGCSRYSKWNSKRNSKWGRECKNTHVQYLFSFMRKVLDPRCWSELNWTKWS